MFSVTGAGAGADGVDGVEGVDGGAGASSGDAEHYQQSKSAWIRLCRDHWQRRRWYRIDNRGLANGSRLVWLRTGERGLVRAGPAFSWSEYDYRHRIGFPVGHGLKKREHLPPSPCNTGPNRVYVSCSHGDRHEPADDQRNWNR